MSAVEEIQAAIAKLTRQRDLATEGPWSSWHPADGHGDSCVDGATHDPDNPPTAAEGGRHDVVLIVTLHRTIDAQLAILSRTAELHPRYAALGREDEWLSAVERAGDLALARAINGGTQ